MNTIESLFANNDFNVFLKKREKKKFTWDEVKDILEKVCLYETATVATGRTQPGKWTSEQVRKFRKELINLNLPYFAYIKFYHLAGEKYALVAGKTNSWKDDIYFELPFEDYTGKPEDVVYEGKDKAKKWLAARKKDAEWYCDEVLIVYTSQLKKELADDEKDPEELTRLNNLALSIEADIKGLFGLFSS